MIKKIAHTAAMAWYGLFGVDLRANRRRLLGEGAWVMIGQLAAALGTLLGMRLLTEFVSPETFGTVSLLLGLGALGIHVGCSPILQAALRFYPDTARNNGLPQLRRCLLRWLRAAALGLCVIVLAGGAGWAAWQKTSFWPFAALAALLVTEIVRSLESNLLTAARRQQPFALWSAVEAWARPVLAVLAVGAMGATSQAVLLGYAVATAGAWVWFQLRFKRADHAEPHVVTQVAPGALATELRRYALPLMPLAILGWISSLGNRYIVGGLIGLEETGIYVAIYGLMSRPFLMVGSVVTLTMRPVYFDAVSVGDRTRQRRILRDWFLFTGVFCLSGTTLSFLLRNWLTTIFLAEEFRSGASLIPWIAGGQAFYVLANVLENVIYAHKRTTDMLRLHSAVAAVALVSTMAGAFWFGLVGVAIACPVYYLVHLLLTFYFARTQTAPDLAPPTVWHATAR